MSAKGASGFRQVVFTSVTVDNTCTAEEDCLSVDITTTGNSYLLINASAHAQTSTSGGGCFFKFHVNGTVLDGEMVTRAPSNNGSGSGAYVRTSAVLAAGTHTVLIKWRPTSTQTGTLTVTGGSHHCHMSVMEIGN